MRANIETKRLILRNLVPDSSPEFSGKIFRDKSDTQVII